MLLEELRSSLSRMGIAKGDIILVSSDVSQILNRILQESQNELTSKKGLRSLLNKIIDLLQDLIGKDGTILFPTYSWDFCKGKTFDPVKTKGRTGELGNTALKREDFKRTWHPLYSFAVWGKLSNELCLLKNTDSWGKESVFQFLYDHHAKNVVLDARDYFTFSHYYEQKTTVPYRYFKSFTSDYKDADSVRTETVTMYVRDLDMKFSDRDESLVEPLLIEAGAMTQTDLDGIKIGVIDVVKAETPIVNDILNNKSNSLIVFED